MGTYEEIITEQNRLLEALNALKKQDWCGEHANLEEGIVYKDTLVYNLINYITQYGNITIMVDENIQYTIDNTIIDIDANTAKIGPGKFAFDEVGTFKEIETEFDETIEEESDETVEEEEEGEGGEQI